MSTDEELRSMAEEVSAVFTDKALNEILIDLARTRSAAVTMNRILDGEFLKGTSLDPSLYFGGGSSIDLLQQPSNSNNPEIICIDDDDEDQSTGIHNDSVQINQSYLQGNHGNTSWNQNKVDDLMSQISNIESAINNVQLMAASSARSVPRGTARSARETKKLIKEREKEEKRLERLQQKAERDAEKQRIKELRQANKLKTDKQEMMREMIVEMESSFLDSPIGRLIKSILLEKQVTIQSLNYPTPNIITWSRRVTTRYDPIIEAYTPILEKIEQESHVLVYQPMQSFAKMVSDATLHAFCNGLQRSFANKKLLLLIEGMDDYMKKSAKKRNREFADAVRNAMGTDENTPSRRRKRSVDVRIDEALVQEELIWLQLVARCLVIHTKNEKETAEMVGILTTDIATIPYKNKNLDLNVCIEGQVRAGTDSRDAWIRMLEEIQLVTHPVASSIVERYPTVSCLYDAYRQCNTHEQRELLLADIEVPTVGLSRRFRTVGPALSKRIHQIFTEDDSDILIA
ncbi:3778_t:CDS:2 [Paraglomus occultum]|uniref:3778_t:CDS:1 n=1 Tax=Paraglomus occultum TaxID=144539 RepID=A0A9N9C8P4_9GLOM|nr:3778_t:CDS:2 [Paraglomus occultum]